jgi:hypothetical protein
VSPVDSGITRWTESIDPQPISIAMLTPHLDSSHRMDASGPWNREATEVFGLDEGQVTQAPEQSYG